MLSFEAAGGRSEALCAMWKGKNDVPISFVLFAIFYFLTPGARRLPPAA
jgi:hypothetical protein